MKSLSTKSNKCNIKNKTNDDSFGWKEHHQTNLGMKPHYIYMVGVSFYSIHTIVYYNGGNIFSSRFLLFVLEYSVFDWC